MKHLNINFTFRRATLNRITEFLQQQGLWLVTLILSCVSVYYFIHYLDNGLGLNYNDARSHLDIGRRVVEGLKPGLAQLGSVWLPLNHFLMIPLIWNDWAWHSGFAGAFWNMLSFVATGSLIYKFLENLKVGLLARFFGVFVFAANLNMLYLQSTAMTEPLLIFTMTIGCYYLMKWAQSNQILELLKASFWIMLSTLVRYDGWLLLIIAVVVVALITFIKRGYVVTEGITILFLTMGAFGILLWIGWNWLIFKDPLFFAFGPYSAHAQQSALLTAGNLPTKGDFLLSGKMYFYAALYNCIAVTAFLGISGITLFWLDRRYAWEQRFSAVALLSPLIFNILALYLGFSVLFIQGVSGNTWFNVRYGIMLLPTLAIFMGYLVSRLAKLRWVIIGLFLFVTFFAFANNDAVTIDDAQVGSSQKNVTEIANYLRVNAAGQTGFILISAASHDAIIFSSGLPMKRFIHEGTGAYWDLATQQPDRWARWIVMRTYDNNDSTYRLVSQSPGFEKYNLVDSYPFADVYKLDDQYLTALQTEPVLGRQK